MGIIAVVGGSVLVFMAASLYLLFSRILYPHVTGILVCITDG